MAEKKLRTVKAAHSSKLISRKDAAKLFRAKKEGRPFMVKIGEDGRRVVVLEPRKRGKC